MATSVITSVWAPPVKHDYDAMKAVGPKDHKALIAEADPIIEEHLYGGHHAPAGEALQALKLDVTVEGPTNVQPIEVFDDANIHPIVLENLKKCGYIHPTAIQAYCIPALLAGLDLVAVSQTGSGKTAAYMIPIASKLMGRISEVGGPRIDTRAEGYNPERHRVRAEPLAVIVCPTRELAHQIFHETCRIAYRSKLLPVCVYGGVPEKNNVQQLGKGCDILIGTPGRICSLMEKGDVLSMVRAKWTILDEADEMLNEDWSEQMDTIMSGGDNNQDEDHRYMMFSATFPRAARQLAQEYMIEQHVQLYVGRVGSTHKNVKQDIIWVDDDLKWKACYDLLMSMPGIPTIVFCNTISRVEQLDDYLYNNKDQRLPTTFMHGKRSQFERDDAMRSFRLGSAPILVTTPVAARGIDFANVTHVINVDLPSGTQGGINEYVHRIGRTARIGHIGQASSFYNERNQDIAQDLVATLMEQDQTIPDFLQEYKPADGKIVFQDDLDDVTDAVAGADLNGGGWGGDGNGNGDGGWGSNEDAGQSADISSNTAEVGTASDW